MSEYIGREVTIYLEITTTIPDDFAKAIDEQGESVMLDALTQTVVDEIADNPEFTGFNVSGYSELEDPNEDEKIAQMLAELSEDDMAPAVTLAPIEGGKLKVTLHESGKTKEFHCVSDAMDWAVSESTDE